MTDSEFLQWVHDRLEYVHGENHNYDYMHRLRAIIDHQQKLERKLTKEARPIHFSERGTPRYALG